MFPSDCVVTNKSGEYRYIAGAFFRLPPDLFGREKILNYSRLTRTGWHNIDYGYLAYVYNSDDLNRYCFPGIIPDNLNFKNKLKIPDYLRVNNFNKYIEHLIEREQAMLLEAGENINLLIHDLRRISLVIQDSAFHAKITGSRTVKEPQLEIAIENIIAAQGVLKMRIDMLDYEEGGNGEDQNFSQVYAYRKIDKVVRFFRPISKKKSISLNLKGESRSATYGPKNIEIIPYIIIDNAIKYSPNNSSIDLYIFEDNGFINFHVTSLGPEILEHEKELIFEKGYRGQKTKVRGDFGSGLGLFICKQIIKKYNGDVFVDVGPRDIDTSKGLCRDIKFCVKFPISI